LTAAVGITPLLSHRVLVISSRKAMRNHRAKLSLGRRMRVAPAQQELGEQMQSLACLMKSLHCPEWELG